MISFTDEQLAKLPEEKKVMYEAYCALEAVLGWIDSGKNKSAQSFIEAVHQSKIARFLLQDALDIPRNTLGTPQNKKEETESLIEHAKKELELKGWLNLPKDDPQAWVVENVLELLEVFAKQRHSGTSAPYVANLFFKLAKFDILEPLTGEDTEWVECGDGFFQNKRCFHVFKNANGVAWDIRGVVWKEGDRCFTDKHSHVPITFPYQPITVYKDVKENPNYEIYLKEQRG